MEDPSGKREVDMWHVAAGCLAVAGILSREPGLTLAGLLIWVGRASVARGNAEPQQPVDSLLQVRRTLIMLAVALLVAIAIVRPSVKNWDCVGDNVVEMFLLLHFVSCWSLWRDFALEKRRIIAGVSLGLLAVVLLNDQLHHSGCERYAPSLIANVLSWLVVLDNVAICVVALSKSQEEKHVEYSRPLVVPPTMVRDNERKSVVTSTLPTQSKRVALGLVLVLTFLLLFRALSGGLGGQAQPPRDPEIIFSDFLNQVDRDQVAQVTIQGHTIHVQLVSGERFFTYAPDDTDLIKKLREKGVKILAKPEGDEP
jgi:hypothetical protein